jgi:hypothetical protein
MQKKTLYRILMAFFLCCSCATEEYNYIDTRRVSGSNSRIVPYNYPYGYQGKYEDYRQPYSRGYRNPYSRPPRNYYPYYDYDVYYVPPDDYYTTEPEHEIYNPGNKI